MKTLEDIQDQINMRFQEEMKNNGGQALLADVDAICENCSNQGIKKLATYEIVYTNVSNTIHYICDDCLNEHEKTAEEINKYEIETFNGGYGIITWKIKKLSVNVG